MAGEDGPDSGEKHNDGSVEALPPGGARWLKPLRDGLRRPLALADAGMNRLYGWQGNPLYQSGTLVVLAFVIMLLTGLYLLLFYRVGDPYASMLRIEGQVWGGRWIRALHRYAADLTVVATLVHVLRMFVQSRSWGGRSLAWVSGVLLFFFMFVCGWTGYVMIWDEHGRLLAVQGAKLLDALPIFSEPIARTFVGERPMPGAFFFLNLFAHVALPIGVALLLWVHVSRLARPILLPPRALTWSTLGLLLLASLIWPAPLGPRADLFALPETVKIDWLYSFWIPLTADLSPAMTWATILGLGSIVVLAPLWTRPATTRRPPASQTAPMLCTGCFQCALDCPYEAIEMIEIAERDHPVARVTPAQCVSCGICAGSCAPMAVGPPLRTGRAEIEEVRAFLARSTPAPGDVVVISCRQGIGGEFGESLGEAATLYPTLCAGNLHTSVVEFLLRAGVGGVLLAVCPPRDCWGREGPRWLHQRLYEGREAELRESIDRRRLRVVYAGEAERSVVRNALEAFQIELSALAAPQAEERVEIETVCEPLPEEARP